MDVNVSMFANGFSLDDSQVHGPIPESRIQDAEDALEVKFPPSYRNFLLHLGAVDDIAGLPDPPLPGEIAFWFNVVERSNSMLSDLHGNRFHKNLLYLNNNGGDLCYYLDSSRIDQDGDYPVVILGPGYDSVIFAKNFFEFFKLSYGI